MTRQFHFVSIMLLMVGSVWAQNETGSRRQYRNFPVVITLQFHSLAMPFKDLKTNFRNIGIGIGTEVSLNGRHDWAQEFTLAYAHNKSVGDRLMLYTQAAWRPSIDNVFGALKLGAGYCYTFHPNTSYQFENGQWTSVGHRGKGLLMMPAGLSAGYHHYEASSYVSPFVTYQFILLSGYNKSVPIIPETIAQTGAAVHFK